MTFSESDIRPKEFDEGTLQSKQADRDWLAKKKPLFVNVDCPACSGKIHEKEYEKNGFHFDRCKACRTVFMNPRPTESILAEFYAHSELFKYWNANLYPASRAVRYASR